MSRRLQRSWDAYQAREKRAKAGQQVAVKWLPKPEAPASPKPIAVTSVPSDHPVNDVVRIKKLAVVEPVTAEPQPAPQPQIVTKPASEPKQKLKKPKKRRRLQVAWLAAGVAVLLVAVGVSALIRWGSQPASSTAVLPAKTAQTVEEMAAIESDEQPVVLTVTDKTKVQQEFLSRAENGDQVMLYYQARKAVLYRPSENKVIATGEFTPPPAKVFLRGGNVPPGRLAETEKNIKALPGFILVSQDKSTTSYPRTIVVDVSKRYASSVEELARTLGADVASLPPGETAPEADILVIVGAR